MDGPYGQPRDLEDLLDPSLRRNQMLPFEDVEKCMPRVSIPYTSARIGCRASET